MALNSLFTLSFCLIGLASISTPLRASEAPVLDVLQSFSDDYEMDVTFATNVTFGVSVGEDFYTVVATPKSDEAEAQVTVTRDKPAFPVFYYTFKDREALAKLGDGGFNALTLMGKAFSSDVTPMDIEFQEGFEAPDNFVAQLLPLTFHFWTKGKPEFIEFGADNTRMVHGTNTGILYYQPGFRSGWFNILPGQHVNEDENSRTNPFPSMFILISGEVTALIDGEELVFREGNAMLAPAGVSHQFINNGDDPAFGFLFMFGDGA